jgi:type II secretory pathway component PulM
MRSPRLQRALIWLGVVIALTLVTLSYFQPTLVVDLGNRIWACF